MQNMFLLKILIIFCHVGIAILPIQANVHSSSTTLPVVELL